MVIETSRVHSIHVPRVAHSRAQRTTGPGSMEAGVLSQCKVTRCRLRLCPELPSYSQGLGLAANCIQQLTANRRTNHVQPKGS